VLCSKKVKHSTLLQAKLHLLREVAGARSGAVG
jgi:hypothetical protein